MGFFGPGASSGQTTQAIQGLQGVAGTATDRGTQQYNLSQTLQPQTTAFNLSRMTNGLPFYRNLTDYNQGTVAQAYAPVRAAAIRQMGPLGNTNLPSGYRSAVLNSINAQQARDFDATQTQAMMANEMAKQQGAQNLTQQGQFDASQAAGYGNQAVSANNSILGARQSGSWAGLLGGVASSALGSGGIASVAL